MYKRCVVSKKIFCLICLTCCIIILLFFEYNPFHTQETIRPVLSNLYQQTHNKKDTIKNDLIVVYNRIPKTGSTSFINVAYDICSRNSYNVIHLNITKNSHYMSLADQNRFVTNITYWYSKKPALYHGHIGYIHFPRFGAPNPIFINILRKPLDRFISYYYFLRYGDNYRPHLIRKKHGDNMTFDECVRLNKPDCNPDNMWLQIPFLCGQNAFCWQSGNEWALQEAKRNLVKEYLLVGLTEDILSFISILETVLPQFFSGATNHFLTHQRNHLRKTNKKINPSSSTVAIIEKSKIWQLENELYQFAYQQFQFIKNQMMINKNKILTDRGILFRFEKIYPKPSSIVN